MGAPLDMATGQRSWSLEEWNKGSLRMLRFLWVMIDAPGVKVHVSKRREKSRA
jgi:hypothetical protein